MAEAYWQVGTLTVPSSTGDVSVTGLDDTPAAVFFYGTNWLTEDTAVTTTGTALFRGMAAPKWDAPGTIVQNVASLAPAGDAHLISNHAIMSINTAGGAAVLYRASLTSFNADGFTVNFDTAAAGGYKVIYIALLDVTEVGGFVGTTNTTLALGWKAGASLLHGAWGGPSISGADRTQEFYGGGAYFGSTASNWQSASVTAGTFPTAPSAQYVVEINNNPPAVQVATGMHFISSFLVTANIRAFPSGGSLTSFTFDGDANDGGMLVVWDDEDSRAGRVTPATTTAGTTTVTGLPFEPGLLLGYTISNEPDGQGTGGRGAAGFFVVTQDFQWAAVVDGVSDRGSFQSFSRGFADAVSGTDVHAGTVELTSDGFILTTEEDDVAPMNVVWHAFGHPQPLPFMPQFYRLLPGGRIGPIVVPAQVRFESGPATVAISGVDANLYPLIGFVLLENGDQIILEDGTGFLLL